MNAATLPSLTIAGLLLSAGAFAAPEIDAEIESIGAAGRHLTADRRDQSRQQDNDRNRNERLSPAHPVDIDVMKNLKHCLNRGQWPVVRDLRTAGHVSKYLVFSSPGCAGAAT